ncbi:hypothetical protein A2634_00475 [Candidatus Amesbacteria bacterium RIFCSPHIGHO2_01_FULL_48_32]|uniref:Uncharacterized protein n=1 Tax=Candidatus Amesbacteria bacterium RIFCSPLOWO2_01_FULL_48_25 TaxID=1797259 RepID=A0A1F4ZAN1_9BACT|nr:MAG: hypothetical protein A2634_00475 [Candidatus Amesbacteria bacterium RIFCSPHIGHO2_01_FULL_48_32]OGD03282.1 MAG: hypothetical protein A2989_00425 [Candidatus Amesbacteria bacterium RIFCSPLOWO2_01_FULL_48_25]HJZ05230.1 hypothetical protein [Patescibacteria group bacterium]
MANAIQLLLVVVVCTLTFLLAFAALQVFHLIHEFRQTLRHLNQYLDRHPTIAHRGEVNIGNFFTEVKKLVNETQDEIVNSTPDRVISTPAHPRRFFHRSHTPLHPS